MYTHRTKIQSLHIFSQNNLLTLLQNESLDSEENITIGGDLNCSLDPARDKKGGISDTSLAFLDIKLSIEGNGLCTSVHYKPTDSHSYFVVFIFTSITCQEFYSLFSAS